jgi:hypothetical protein
MFVIFRRICLLLAVVCGGLSGRAQGLPTADTGEESDFLPAIQMAPFVVRGDDSAVFVHARSRGDRRYAEEFAEDVVEVNYDALGESTGRGLVIVGRKGEPHPVFVFRKFIAMADAGQLHPSVAPMVAVARGQIEQWTEETEVDDRDVGITFDMIAELLPLPLSGPGSKLYQWAWLDDFEIEEVELRFARLRAEDFAINQLDTYDWVFYLPPKSAVHRVIKRVLPAVMEAEDMGFMARTAARGAVVAFRPVITKAMEAMRKGMLFYTITKARTDYSKDDREQLSRAYGRVLMPDFKFNGGTENQRAVEAVQAQVAANLAYAKDPYITPERLSDYDPADYRRLVGNFVGQDEDGEEELRRFAFEDGTWTWSRDEETMQEFFPASPRKLVSADGQRTLEFQLGDSGKVIAVEQRQHRARKTFVVAP